MFYLLISCRICLLPFFFFFVHKHRPIDLCWCCEGNQIVMWGNEIWIKVIIVFWTTPLTNSRVRHCKATPAKRKNFNFPNWPIYCSRTDIVGTEIGRLPYSAHDRWHRQIIDLSFTAVYRAIRFYRERIINFMLRITYVTQCRRLGGDWGQWDKACPSPRRRYGITSHYALL